MRVHTSGAARCIAPRPGDVPNEALAETVVHLTGITLALSDGARSRVRGCRACAWTRNSADVRREQPAALWQTLPSAGALGAVAAVS